MPVVSYAVPFSKPNPSVLSANTRAVPAALYRPIESEAGEPGGVTASDIDPQQVRALGDFSDGDEVYVEGEPDDVLDDTDDDTAAATRIWFRARLLER
jgi:hypothetical protein